MSSKKELKARMVQKHDLTENWRKSILIPEEGEIIIYDDAPEKIKIGDGRTIVSKLPFLTSSKEVAVQSEAPEDSHILIWIDNKEDQTKIKYKDTDGQWCEISNGSGVGKMIPPNGGEIFNDYEHNTATGLMSHAEGYTTAAAGDYSHAEGCNRYVAGKYSHAEGLSLKDDTKKSINIISSTFNSDNKIATIKVSLKPATTHIKRETSPEVCEDFFLVRDRFFETGFIFNQHEYIVQSYTPHWIPFKSYTNNNIEFTINLTGPEELPTGPIEVSLLPYGAYGSEFSLYGDGNHAEGIDTLAKGEGSHAEGYMSKVIEGYDSEITGAHAEGRLTFACAIGSHSEGCTTQTFGTYSHAEGLLTSAHGSASHAEGGETQAIGIYSHAEGMLTDSEGRYSHAEGYRNQATTECSHAEGDENIASGESSHAEGRLNTASGLASHAEGQEGEASGPHSHVEGLCCWGKGPQDHAEGYSSHALGGYSHAEGYQSESLGCTSHAEGSNCKAEGYSSHAEGVGCKAIGSFSHAEGSSSESLGDCSHAEGGSTTAAEKYSHAEGHCTEAEGIASHVEGVGCSCSGSASQGAHAEGFTTHAFYPGAHAEGMNSHAYGRASHAEGHGFAYRDASHAEGCSVTYHSYSHAEGSSAAYGQGSHAEGLENYAMGSSSHVEGSYSKAIGENAHSEGGSLSIEEPLQILPEDLPAHLQESILKDTLVDNKEVSFYENDDDFCVSSEIPFEANTTYKIILGGVTWYCESMALDNSEKEADSPQPKGFISCQKYDPETQKTIQYFTIKNNFTGAHFNKQLDIEHISQECKDLWIDKKVGQTGNIITHFSFLKSDKVLTKGTQAIGNFSHAEGHNTIAYGNDSHTEGNQTITTSDYSHVEGKNNLIDKEEKYAHIVGNGTDNKHRSNAHTVDWDGNAWYVGHIYSGGTSQDDPQSMDLVAEILALKEEIAKLKASQA